MYLRILTPALITAALLFRLLSCTAPTVHKIEPQVEQSGTVKDEIAEPPVKDLFAVLQVKVFG